MSRRTDKVNELLRREIGTTIQRDFEFPGTIVTVIEVEVTDDLKEGKVWVGVVGKMAPSQVLEKLNSRHGLIQPPLPMRKMTGSNILPLAKARCPRPYRAGCAGTAEGRNTQNHASGKNP